MKVHYSSKQSDWETPQEFFDVVHREFDFTLDVCATSINAKCAGYYTERVNGLAMPWHKDTCWMNPPYGRAINDWMAKAHLEASLEATVICLVPARTDTKWWWHFCLPWEIRFLPGRLHFVTLRDGIRIEDPAPFPSALVVMGRLARPHATLWWDWKKGIYR